MNCNFIYRIKQAFACCCKPEDVDVIHAINLDAGLDKPDAEAGNGLALHLSSGMLCFRLFKRNRVDEHVYEQNDKSGHR
jgi:hypothetical protein